MHSQSCLWHACEAAAGATPTCNFDAEAARRERAVATAGSIPRCRLAAAPCPAHQPPTDMRIFNAGFCFFSAMVCGYCKSSSFHSTGFRVKSAVIRNRKERKIGSCWDVQAASACHSKGHRGMTIRQGSTSVFAAALLGESKNLLPHAQRAAHLGS